MPKGSIQQGWGSVWEQTKAAAQVPPCGALRRLRGSPLIPWQVKKLIMSRDLARARRNWDLAGRCSYLLLMRWKFSLRNFFSDPNYQEKYLDQIQKKYPGWTQYAGLGQPKQESDRRK